MAVFGNKIDQSLPLLTQLYQLEPQKPGELVQWLRQAERVRLIPSWAELANIVDAPDTHAAELHKNGLHAQELVAEGTLKEWRTWPTWEETLADTHRRAEMISSGVVELVGIVRRVLDAAVDIGDVSAEDLERLGRWASLRIELRHWDHANVPVVGGVVPIDKIATMRMVDAAVEDPVAHMKTEVALALIEVIKALRAGPGKRLPVGRCPECGSVFVFWDRARGYCSHRCAARVGQRERMRERVRGWDKH